jgi:predicted DCC family thiol-disulfide oxidoreductase YuxK
MSALTESPTQTSLTSERHPLLLFYDGECSFCGRWVNRVRLADHRHRMRFGPKQGGTFQKLAQEHPEVADVESVVVVKRLQAGSEIFLVRSAAIRAVIEGLPEFRFFDLVLRIVPTALSDFGYRLFSKMRSLLFSRWHHVRAPLEQDKELYVA